MPAFQTRHQIITAEQYCAGAQSLGQLLPVTIVPAYDEETHTGVLYRADANGQRIAVVCAPGRPELVLHEGEWLVRKPDGDLKVMSADAFEAYAEPIVVHEYDLVPDPIPPLPPELVAWSEDAPAQPIDEPEPEKPHATHKRGKRVDG